MPQLPAYRPHSGFVAPAAGRAEPWRTASGIAITLVAGLALYQLTLAVLTGLLGPDLMSRLLDETTFYRETPRSTLVALFSYGFFGAGLLLALQALHGRRLASLLGPQPLWVVHFIRSGRALLVLFVALAVLLPYDPAPIRNASMPLSLWLILLPISLAAIAVQAGTEELVFRGYLQQQLAAWLPAWPVWMIVPALLFGLLHWSPEAAGANAGFYVLWAAAFGVLAADLTARTGTLGPALALHIMTNATAILGLSLMGPGAGLALYHLPMEFDDAQIAALMPVEMLTLLISWLTVRLALRV